MQIQLIRFITIMSLILGVAAGTFAAQDDTVDGDADETTAPVNLVILLDGEAVTDTLDINALLHARLYTFSASESDVVRITMNTSDEDLLDPFLLIYGPTGQLVAVNDDGDDGVNSEIPALEIVESGSYYVLATTWNSISIIFNYGADIVAETTTPEPIEFTVMIEGNTDPELPHNITMMSPGEILEVEITQDTAIGYVVFEADAGDTVSLYAESDKADTLLYFFDAEGLLVAVSDDIDFAAGNTNSQILNFTITTDGPHLVFVTVVDYDTAIMDDVTYKTGMITFKVD